MAKQTASAAIFLAGGGEMGALIRAHDWSSTPLGSPDTWPHSLLTSLRIMLTSRQPIWIGWGEDLIYFYNDAYKSIIGGRHPSALGRPTREIWREIWPDIGPMLATAMSGAEGTYVEEQLLIMERNGYPEETYYTFSYSPIPDDDGAPGGIICANSEDTDRVVGERQISLLRELAAQTVNSLTRDEACRRSIEALSGNQRDITFAALYDVEHGADRAIRRAALNMAHSERSAPASLPLRDGLWPVQDVIEGGLVVVAGLESRMDFVPVGPWDLQSSQAAILPIAATGDFGRSGILVVGLNPYRVLDSKYRGFLGLVAGQIASALATADAYEEERRRAEALAELDRAKTAFFSNVSHEFRTPLTLMLSPLDDALAGNASKEFLVEQIVLARRNGARLLRLVNSLLDFSRIEAGRVQAHFEPTDLAQFSTDIASSFRAAFDKAGLAFRVTADRLPQPVYVDRDMWEKVLLNLLSNAFKFTLEGGVTVVIDDCPAGARVRVEDTGIGVPESEVPRLFERFHRVEGAQGRSFEGSGIGLALVHELVRQHGGDITVSSTHGQGTTFTVILPYGADHLPGAKVFDADAALPPRRTAEFLEEALRWLPDDHDSPQGRAEAGDLGVADLTQGGRGKRILLADDNADMRAYVSRLLERHGYTVAAVADGEAALDLAQRDPPDLVLTDVMMPKLDGFGLLRQLRAGRGTESLPVIMLSARAGEEAKVEGLGAGADDYLVKPFSARELVARVNATIQMAQFRRESERAIWRSEQRFRVSEDRLAMALSTGDVGVYEWEVEADRVSVLGPLSGLYGVDQDTAEEGGSPLSTFLAGVHPDDRDRVSEAINTAVDGATPLEVEYRVVGNGEERVVVARGITRPGGHDGGRLLAGAIIDVTEDRRSRALLQQHQATLEDQARALRILNRAASAVAGDLDQDRLIQTITDAAVEITRAEFGAFFYSVVADDGTSYQLYTISGVSKEAFAGFPMPRNTPVFAHTFGGHGVVRSGDITRDPRYGTMEPHHGMPSGHLPVRSYLAAPVKARDGEVIGALFFGHSAPDQFDEKSEERCVALAAQAAVALENARLFQSSERELAERRKVEAALQALNATLEARVEIEVAERVKTEEALRQAQKMEMVGQLTGGVAHDFNNLLTVIMGGLDTIRRSPVDDARVQRAAAMAMQGAERAAGLTKRLLAFSRRQPLDPKPLDLNHLVREMTDLLHRSLGEQTELECILGSRLWTVEVDPNQLESAVLNLAVNARDAMPGGGKLTIETFNASLDESYAAVDKEVIPGQYAVVSVSDTGRGMQAETLARVFEPFFTTKDVGKGTGLGLSMVYGFVKQSGGHVTIYSEPGEGTTVKLYFPRFVGASHPEVAVDRLPTPGGVAGEVVLVVEDNDDVRAYSVMILTELGYQVLEAAEADSALALIAEKQRRIDLLFTDVVLPGKSGRVLADAAHKIRPDLKVLYTTGYSRNAIVHHGRLDPGVQLITKPFTSEDLAGRVRDVLDARSV